MNETETYGQKVRRLRKDRGWTQRELAEASGVPYRTVQDVEADRRDKPHRGTVLALNRTLDIEGDESTERAGWPNDIQVILDIVGAYLMTLEPAERSEWIRSTITETVLGNRARHH